MSDRDHQVLTTGQVARICRVAPRTVSKWFDSGQLRGYRIPGSKDRRIPLQQLIRFMKAHGIPMDALEGDVMRVLVIDADRELCDLLQRTLSEQSPYRVDATGSVLEAGALAHELLPQVLIVDTDTPGVTPREVTRFIASRADLQATRLIATSASFTDADRSTLLQEGFHATLGKPYHVRELLALIDRLLH